MKNELKLIQVTPETLVEIVKDAISQEIEKVKNQFFKTIKQSDYLTKKEVAKKLKISIGTLDNWINKGKIPFHKVGRRVLFKESEIEESINQLKNDKYEN